MATGRFDEEQLARLIPQAFEGLPDPDQARLDAIEQRLLAQAPACPRPRVRRVRRRIPWWVAGLWVAAASAAAWWGVAQWQAPASTPAAVETQGTTVLPPSPPAREAHPQTPPPSGEAPARPAPQRHPSPFVFRR